MTVVENTSDLMNLNQAEDEKWMQFAYEQAALAAEIGEIPVGAIIVSQGQVIGQGYNHPITLQDPTAHAEIIAIRHACQNINNYRLPEDATLYVTLEPCQMCAGAIIQSRIKEVVMGSMNPKAGCGGSVLNILQMEQFNHQAIVRRGVMEEECAEVLTLFFKQLREKNKEKKAEKTRAEI